jgi:glycosyltransferase involved in cell wall biosynthesis
MSVGRSPKISVICAAYNGQAYLPETIRCLIAQQEKNFEAIIVDDASTDDTSKILESVDDERFRIIRNEKNSRIIYSRNRAISAATGKYIAVTDQDDLSCSVRLSKQADVLDKNPEISAVYSLVKAIDSTGRGTVGMPDWCYSGEEARAGLLFHNFVTHSTLMFRKELAPDPAYSLDYPFCEDYNLIAKLADSLSGLCVIRSRLVSYRFHDNNLSKSSEKEMTNLSERLRRELLGRIGLTPTAEEMKLHNYFEGGVTGSSIEQFRQLRNWVEFLRDAVLKSRYVDIAAFDEVLALEWLSVSHKFSHLGREVWKEYCLGPRTYSRQTLSSVVKLWVKSMR